MIRTALNSPSLRTALALALGGVAFTVGNLLLARALAPDQYGLVTLFIGVLSVASLVAPAGLDLVIARRGLSPGPHLRRAVLIASTCVGLATAVVAAATYGLTARMATALFVAVAAAGVVQTVTAYYQGQKRFGVASWLLQTTNFILIPVALLAVAPAAMIAALTTVVAAVAWLATPVRMGSLDSGAAAPAGAPLWREAISLVAITSAASVFMQLERLVLVPTAGIQSLALFGVLSALVSSPYRMLQSAVQFTLIPELRAATGVSERRQLLARELLIVTVVGTVGAGVLWFLAPWLSRWLLAGHYELTETVMLAAIVSGLLKVASAFATSVAVALGDDRELRWVSLSAWLSIGVATAGAFVAAPWGLAGVLYGIGAGWVARTVVTAWIAAPHLFPHTPRASRSAFR
ncbi:MAG TPA: hypothetical protein VGM84_12225 [Steroidobacteraceae bacterium]|jgi:O-antigen/teichoic acid export membrane protein